MHAHAHMHAHSPTRPFFLLPSHPTSPQCFEDKGGVRHKGWAITVSSWPAVTVQV